MFLVFESTAVIFDPKGPRWLPLEILHIVPPARLGLTYVENVLSLVKIERPG